jgi:hypothetical protein
MGFSMLDDIQDHIQVDHYLHLCFSVM